MPIYDFCCPQCKNTKEYYLNLKDDAPLCQKCSTRLVKVVSAPHFKFKNASGVVNANSFKTGRKRQTILPVNLVDVNSDGSFRITSTSKDPELVNV